ncbi:MAG: FAD-binding oxidoreductase, partial [Candidatus Rokubacteria bacterium]|nr:FAD-binding oxidoreductase [Candidatus Rokubacteria bacterium]
VHSGLNATRVARVVRPARADDLAAIVEHARRDGLAVSVAGGRHAMGGQQFGAGTVSIDTTAMGRVLAFDRERGQVTVEAGIQWPALVDYLLKAQAGQPRTWGIAQKQTGADRLSIGGAVAANVHGRGLRLPPFVGDVEALTVVNAAGEVRRCNRTQNADLFRLVVGGYGLFGLVATVTLRLAPRRKLQRVVEVIDMDTLPERFERRIAEGFLFGDCQYATDAASGDFLRRGVFSCYRPLDDAAAMPDVQKELSLDDWNRLLHLSHADKRRAFERYAGYYLSTNGQRYWSDTHQLSVYVDGYHAPLGPGSEVITEVYTRRPDLPRFLDTVRTDFRAHDVNVIYGTVRLIERDAETYLPWARDRYACVIFNLHTEHSPEALARTGAHFRRLIDIALGHGGSYFLTYHRHATRAQVEAAYPQFADFLRLKRRRDPAERFQSEWYRHYRAMFA